MFDSCMLSFADLNPSAVIKPDEMKKWVREDSDERGLKYLEDATKAQKL